MSTQPPFDALLVVDPGKITGAALWRPQFETVPWEAPHMEFLHWADDWLQSARLSRLRTRVVCEAFDVTQATLKKSRGEMWSLKQIGALEFFCDRDGHEWFTPLQKPSAAMRLITDDRLRAMGWYHPSKGGHQNDAMRHLAFHLAREFGYRLPPGGET